MAAEKRKENQVKRTKLRRLTLSNTNLFTESLLIYLLLWLSTYSKKRQTKQYTDFFVDVIPIDPSDHRNVNKSISVAACISLVQTAEIPRFVVRLKILF